FSFLSFFCNYNSPKKNNTQGRPKQLKTRTDLVQFRLTDSEKRAFQDAASHAGISVSTWIRERLRRAAIRELEEASIPIASLCERLDAEA
ncbi:MAG TPA: hypothetical protein VJ044_17970, partial [Candidatus Hodarchaeales archaeon]|nr:hypothetical protein [Candidatus Hodarchaeales archaeon]